MTTESSTGAPKEVSAHAAMLESVPERSIEFITLGPNESRFVSGPCEIDHKSGTWRHVCPKDGTTPLSAGTDVFVNGALIIAGPQGCQIVWKRRIYISEKPKTSRG